MSEKNISREELLELFENAPCGYLVVKSSGEIVRANTTIANWTGFSTEKLTGTKLPEILSFASKVFYETHFAPLLAMQGVFDEVALTITKADGKPLPVLVNARQRKDSQGAVAGTLISIFNATDRRRYEQELLVAKKSAEEANASLEKRINESEELGRLLRENEARLRMALEAGQIGSFVIDVAKNEIAPSEQFCRIFGVPFQFVFPVEYFESRLVEEDSSRASSKDQREQGQVAQYSEYRITTADTGEIRWISRQALVTRNDAGMPARMMGTVQDITDRKSVEEHQRMLNEELSHRMKNTMSLVQAIASQTLRDAADRPAVDAFHQRITALSHAHEILLQQSWSAADMGDVVRGVLALHADPSRVALTGPAVNLGPKAALSLSLLLHELATNAVKYGAFSNTAGHIDVGWSVENSELALSWSERGGPSITEPTSTGLGSRLINVGLAGTGKVVKSYHSAGFEVQFIAPLKLVQDN